MYDEHYLNADFNYDDLEAKYAESQRIASADPESLRKELDESHHQ